MHELYTQVKIPNFPFSIGYRDRVLLMGSCFSTHIYQKLAQRQFNVLCNPFGISYNPVSIANGLKQIMSGEHSIDRNLVYHDERYHDFDFHGDFSNASKEMAQKQMNDSILAAAKFLKESTVLILTLGTANAFRLKSNQKIVNNCHKFPGDLFEKKMLTIPEITSALSESFEQLKRYNPKLRIILTVSPIRHIRDGLVTNQQSKSSLIVATHQLIHAHKNIDYFPAYEIMVDELRDYRFYKEDKIHPSDWAINYIWTKFKTAFFEEDTMNLEKTIEKIYTASQHRPILPDSKAHKKFITKQMNQINRIVEKYPFLKRDRMEEWFVRE